MGWIAPERSARPAVTERSSNRRFDVKIGEGSDDERQDHGIGHPATGQPTEPGPRPSDGFKLPA